MTQSVNYCIAKKDGGKVFLELTTRQLLDGFSDPIVDYCWEEEGQVFIGRTRLSSLSHLEKEVLPEEESCHVESVELP